MITNKYLSFYLLVYLITAIVVISCDSSINEIGKKDVLSSQDTGNENDIAISDEGYIEDRETILDSMEGDGDMDLLERDETSVGGDDGSEILGEDTTDTKSTDVVTGDTDRTDGEFVCTGPCDCPDGYLCESGWCKYWKDTFGPYTFCCLHNECPAGTNCVYPSGEKSTCISDAGTWTDIVVEDSGGNSPDSGYLDNQINDIGGLKDCIDISVSGHVPNHLKNQYVNPDGAAFYCFIPDSKYNKIAVNIEAQINGTGDYSMLDLIVSNVSQPTCPCNNSSCAKWDNGLWCGCLSGRGNETVTISKRDNSGNFIPIDPQSFYITVCNEDKVYSGMFMISWQGSN